jgi:hypothetical protein
MYRVVGVTSELVHSCCLLESWFRYFVTPLLLGGKGHFPVAKE